MPEEQTSFWIDVAVARFWRHDATNDCWGSGQVAASNADYALARIHTLFPCQGSLCLLCGLAAKEKMNRGLTTVTMPKSTRMAEIVVAKLSQSRILRKCLGRPYLRANMSIWNHLPAAVTSWRGVRGYGCHLHGLIQLRATRMQRLGTFFFRNRPELELLSRLLDAKPQGSTLDVTVLACSKGAEVYSISYTLRCARADLKVRLRALDIDGNVLEFAREGVYSLSRHNVSGRDSVLESDVVVRNTSKDQATSIFERMSSGEIQAMFDRDGDRVTVKPQFREGISWHLGDAGDPGLADVLGQQDIVVANRFLCHMRPQEAEACLRNLARLVKPGGYLFVSGVDLSVRSEVARKLRWRPVTESDQRDPRGRSIVAP